MEIFILKRLVVEKLSLFTGIVTHRKGLKG